MKRKSEHKIAGALRISLVGLALIAQFTLIIALTYFLRDSVVYVYFLIQTAAVIQVFTMVSRNRNSSYTIAWLLVIMMLPVFGNILYLLWGRNSTKGIRNIRLQESLKRGSSFLPKDVTVYQELQKMHPQRRRLMGYLGRLNFPVYKNTISQYYTLGEAHFEAMLRDLEAAKRFIFMEYFIISSGDVWDSIEEVLIRKAKEGVEVRVMYDDFGSIITAPDSLMSHLRESGIAVTAFNPIHHYISRLYINFRNHQKITVIDGTVGYTGGTNLADEYANLVDRHGHWKDTAIRLEGDAVWSFVVTFLQMWDGENGGATDYELYRADRPMTEGVGFYQPFSDGPVNNPENPAETTYRNIINTALDYVYITTPYLVIDNAMMGALRTAAEGGVDVRIITPKQWDHWYVHCVTHSNYLPLLQSGVRIYEYTPGFVHSKMILSDDDNGIVGSINMDYRSFNLHFENGVWICGAPVLADVKADIEETFTKCEEISLEEWEKRPWYNWIIEGALRVIAVLF